jgi:hypothetical protein
MTSGDHRSADRDFGVRHNHGEPGLCRGPAVDPTCAVPTRDLTSGHPVTCADVALSVCPAHDLVGEVAQAHVGKRW